MTEEQIHFCGIYKTTEFKLSLHTVTCDKTLSEKRSLLLLQRPVEKRNLFPCKIFANSSMR